MRIALLQLHAQEVEACAHAGVPAERIAQLLSMAEEQNADLVVFPETTSALRNKSLTPTAGSSASR